MQDALEEVTRNTSWDVLAQNLTVKETAAYLGVTAYTVYGLVHQGKIPYLRFGKQILIPKQYLHPDNAQQRVTQ